MAALFISIDRMPFLAPTLDNADPLFALVIPPGFYQHHVEVADQDPASGNLQAFGYNVTYITEFLYVTL